MVKSLIRKEQDMKEKDSKTTMDFYNMSDFLKGQSSKIITKLSDNDEAAFILKNGKPKAVLISKDRYDRLIQAGIDIIQY
jgi:hypothetical protein